MPDFNPLSAKGQILLKSLVEQYIVDGQPVGSKRLSESSDLGVSSATIRNVMADLEEKGFVSSPHTSAGRIPTPMGYRFFVDSLLKVEPLGQIDLKHLQAQFDPDMTAQELVQSASGMLSEVTHLAGVVTIPRRDQVTLRHVEFLSLNDSRVLAILVLDDHEVQNRVIYTENEYTEIQLKEALLYPICRARAEDEPNDYIVAGQENLFDLSQSKALEDIRELFKAFSLKGDILHLLDRCMESNGMQLFIGQESGYEILDECSVVTSPYQVDGELVGVLGVIGPTRMAYERVIPLVDATARILGAALNNSRQK